MAAQPEPPAQQDDDVIHRLKNDLAIIIGFCDLLMAEFPTDDPRHADLLEVHRAAQDAVAVMPEVTRRSRLVTERK
jgi:signal transduction histidine kinase